MLRLSVLTLLLILVSCGEAEKKKPDTALSEPELGAEAQKDSMPLAVYDYQGLEPLLNRDDGKTYIINFWATWCAPCIKELPYFEQVRKEQLQNDVEVILVSLDMPSMWQSHLIPFIERKKLESEVVILDDPKQNDWIPKIDIDWSGAIPATLIYNNKKRKFYEQPFTYETLNEQLDTFLN
ncbi:TlpA family protein disulfide reductase [Poritiphilus flavus]|uniref:Redoxin domain-containing protein n=1 Tax=Poritiphilus flavus TaxID=2697053 RepID=A0A6L9EAN2_9FLAO|nr:TlpA disulfide reductase family protein [Poritiphilus flavus]NAS11796.1 redoxin domain-containing protein [Poritiphilus flavus]